MRGKAGKILDRRYKYRCMFEDELRPLVLPARRNADTERIEGQREACARRLETVPSLRHTPTSPSAVAAAVYAAVSGSLLTISTTRVLNGLTTARPMSPVGQHSKGPAIRSAAARHFATAERCEVRNAGPSVRCGANGGTLDEVASCLARGRGRGGGGCTKEKEGSGSAWGYIDIA